MSPGESYDIPPWFETGRVQSELFAFQWGQWELIWNIQLIGRYKEMSPGESYNIPPTTTLPGQLQLTFLIFQLYQTLLIDPLSLHYNTGMTTTVNISQISALPGDTADMYTDTKKRYEEKSVLPGYLHLVVQNSIFTCLLSSSGQEWQFHMSTDILWPRMAIEHI